MSFAMKLRVATEVAWKISDLWRSQSRKRSIKFELSSSEVTLLLSSETLSDDAIGGKDLRKRDSCFFHAVALIVHGLVSAW